MPRILMLLTIFALLLAACAGPQPAQEAAEAAQDVAVTVYESPT